MLTRVRKHIGLLMICLVIGAIINIVVALGCAVFFDESAAREWLPMQSGAQQVWMRYSPEGWPAQPTSSFRMNAFGRTLHTLHHFPSSFQSQSWTLISYQTGLPMRAFQAIGLASGGSGPEWESSISLETSGFKRVVPAGPIWPGISMNTMFYAAIAWMLIRGPIESRRRWREMRDRCDACGYPRGRSARCTECGADLTRGWSFKPCGRDRQTPPPS